MALPPPPMEPSMQRDLGKEIDAMNARITDLEKRLVVADRSHLYIRLAFWIAVANGILSAIWKFTH